MKHKIELETWDYSCSDGCCHDYGTNLIVNGEVISRYADDNLGATIKALCEKLGVEADVNEKSN